MIKSNGYELHRFLCSFTHSGSIFFYSLRNWIARSENFVHDKNHAAEKLLKTKRFWDGVKISQHSHSPWLILCSYYFGGAREVKDSRRSGMSQICFYGDKIGHAESVGFRFYLAIWWSESQISSRYLEITSISSLYSLTYWRKKELLFWLSRGLNPLTCATRQLINRRASSWLLGFFWLFHEMRPE